MALARAEDPKLPDWLRGLDYRDPEESEPDPVEQSAMHDILDHIRQHYDVRCWAYAAWAFATGMRPEEIVIQTWKDLRLDPKLGHHKTRVWRAKSFRGQIKGTKTGGTRFVDLSQLALDALDAMRPFTEKAEMEIFQNPWSGKGWHDGRSFRENVWNPALKALGIPGRRAYCTRHTFATLLLQAGARIAYVSAQMGHTTPSEVEKTYHRWLPDADGGYARRIMAEAFSKNPHQIPR